MINTNPTKTGCEIRRPGRANKRSRIPKGQSKKDNPQTLATEKKEENQNKNTPQYGLDTTMRKQKKTNRISCYSEIVTVITTRNAERKEK